jgi:hypothetical protein
VLRVLGQILMAENGFGGGEVRGCPGCYTPGQLHRNQGALSVKLSRFVTGVSVGIEREELAVGQVHEHSIGKKADSESALFVRQF